MFIENPDVRHSISTAQNEKQINLYSQLNIDKFEWNKENGKQSRPSDVSPFDSRPFFPHSIRLKRLCVTQLIERMRLNVPHTE